MGFIILLLAGALVGNFLIRRLVRWVDHISPKLDTHSEEKTKLKSAEEILRMWGRAANVPLGELAGPVHRSFEESLQKYTTVGPDIYLRVLDRDLVRVAFKENTSFTQIGVWGDGSEILVRRDSGDPAVYIAECEDGSPGSPVRFAGSFQEYLSKAWDYNADS
jgi:hypothetical protein